MKSIGIEMKAIRFGSLNSTIPRLATFAIFILITFTPLCGQTPRPIPLKSAIQNVQPMTGIVLWTTNEAIETAPIQLEYAYLTYRQATNPDGTFQWSALERLLSEVAGRKHQLILRWHDTYVGKKTGVPEHITNQSDYKVIKGKSEKKATEFPDWSYAALQQFTLDFFTEFGKRYDNDPRLAYVQVGFGLWAEYHIYDGPMELGKTFPSKEYQSNFLSHVGKCLSNTPWMISVDSANSDWSPLEDNEELLKLQFGLFDDSFNHKQHKKENAPNWQILGMDRWKNSPTGGEFAFFDPVEQTKALAPKGPYGISFEAQAALYHVSFMIGDAQPEYQKPNRIRQAGMATGYAFQVTRFESDTGKSILEIENRGIAPCYFDAYPVINGTRSDKSLKGLLPGASRSFTIQAGSASPMLEIQSDRLVPGQSIEFNADLGVARLSEP